MINPIFIFLFSLPLLVLSQENISFSNSNFIEKIDNKLSLKLDIDNDIESFEFNGENLSYRIEPNIDLRTELSVHYRFISFRIGYTPQFLSNNNEDLKGKTKVFKIQTDLYLKNWVQTFEYYKVKGFYLTDLKGNENFSLPDGIEFLILPNLKTVTFRGVTKYKFNNNFSFKALTTQNEIQRKSAGSFVPSLAYSYFEITDKTTTQDLNSYSLILNTGYFYTFVINKKWYSGLGISPGLGIEFNKLITKTDNGSIFSRDNDLVFNLDTHLGLGYNSKSFFGGIDLRFLATTRDENSIIEFDTLRGLLQIFIGYRFNSPKFLKKSVDWIEDQNPLN